jgi:hypothetical protein
MIRAFLVFALLVLHMVQPLVAKPLCMLSESEASACCCCAPMEAGPMQGCCSSDASDESPLQIQLQDCGCSVAPHVPAPPAPVESIELGFVSFVGNWPQVESDEPDLAGALAASLRRRIVCPNAGGPPLRLLTQVFRL